MIAEGTAGQSRTSLVSPNATASLAWTMGPDVVTGTASNSLMEWIWADARGAGTAHNPSIQATITHTVERRRLPVMATIPRPAARPRTTNGLSGILKRPIAAVNWPR